MLRHAGLKMQGVVGQRMTEQNRPRAGMQRTCTQWNLRVTPSSFAQNTLYQGTFEAAVPAPMSLCVIEGLWKMLSDT